jgi:hypothetical protein
VAAKLALATGRRWSLEIETSGMSLNPRNIGLMSGRSWRPWSVVSQVTKKREVQVVDVKVKNVESGCMLADAIEHQHIIGNSIYDMGVETQCGGRAAYQTRGRYGIATSKQRDIVPEFDEFP